jgi:hypothetical protein
MHLSRPLRLGLVGLVGLAVSFLATSGCGRGDAKSWVSGKVTYKGEPLKEGKVSLYKDSTLANVYEIHDDGTFKGAGPEPGEYAVAISGDPIESPEGKRASRNPLPGHYGAPSSSSLTWTIGAGDNSKEFALKEASKD